MPCWPDVRGLWRQNSVSDVHESNSHMCSHGSSDLLHRKLEHNGGPEPAQAPGWTVRGDLIEEGEAHVLQSRAHMPSVTSAVTSSRISCGSTKQHARRNRLGIQHSAQGAHTRVRTGRYAGGTAHWATAHGKALQGPKSCTGWGDEGGGPRSSHHPPPPPLPPSSPPPSPPRHPRRRRHHRRHRRRRLRRRHRRHRPARSPACCNTGGDRKVCHSISIASRAPGGFKSS